VPFQKEIYNFGSYFSGHYQIYGVKFQATCDCNSHLTSISVLCPGGTGDSKAYAASYLHYYVSNLPSGFISLQIMYSLSNTLLVPYSGQDSVDSSKDAFNFYLYQLRIHIVQAFGLLVSKWRIFKKPLEVKLFCVSHIVQACSWLHNFCIDNQNDSAPLILNRDPESFHPNFEEF